MKGRSVWHNSHGYTIPRTFWTDTTYLYPISIPHSLQPQSKIKHPEVIYGWRRKVVLTSNLDAKINRVLKVGSPIGQQTLKPPQKTRSKKNAQRKRSLISWVNNTKDIPNRHLPHCTPLTTTLPHNTQHHTNLETILINSNHQQTSRQTPRDCLVRHGQLHWPLFTTTGKNRTLPTGESTERTHSSSAACFFKVSWPTWSLILPKLLLSLGA